MLAVVSNQQGLHVGDTFSQQLVHRGNPSARPRSGFHPLICSDTPNP
jgi:hypothetical protein